MTIVQILSQELSCPEAYVENVIRLLDEGNTLPFIARYRKELHGGMDDTRLRTLAERLQYLRGLQDRRETVKAAIDGQGKLTEELAEAAGEAAVIGAQPFEDSRFKVQISKVMVKRVLLSTMK